MKARKVRNNQNQWKAHLIKLKNKRRVRNKMAKQSRKQQREN